MGKDKKKLCKHPFVSVCTPTFNRRPFIPIMIKCFEHQTYPKDRIEWIIIDDGTDKIEDLVAHLPQVKYFKYDEKLTLGKKRNLSNEKATGEIIVYMDDDDYYPPDRISHAVNKLRGSKALCAGSSAMFIHFKHINKMYQFGPYGPNHATAATFAFKRELLIKTKFNETASLAEEKFFLKDYTIPFVQLDSDKSILVFSHNHNSFDKKELLKQLPNPTIHETSFVPADLVKEPEILKFFMEDIDSLLDVYEPGRPENKPDVTKELQQIKEKRETMIREEMARQAEYQDTINKINMMNPQALQGKLNEQTSIIQQLSLENSQLQDKVKYLEDKIKQLINERIQEKLQNKQKVPDISALEEQNTLSSDAPVTNDTNDTNI
jgi:glycosyltransferase involved in cell wall biosynthesis